MKCSRTAKKHYFHYRAAYILQLISNFYVNTRPTCFELIFNETLQNVFSDFLMVL